MCNKDMYIYVEGRNIVECNKDMYIYMLRGGMEGKRRWGRRQCLIFWTN